MKGQGTTLDLKGKKNLLMNVLGFDIYKMQARAKNSLCG